MDANVIEVGFWMDGLVWGFEGLGGEDGGVCDATWRLTSWLDSIRAAILLVSGTRFGWNQ